MLRNGVPEALAALTGRLETVRGRLRGAFASAPGTAGLAPARWELREAEVEADQAGRSDLAEALRRTSLLTEIWEGLAADDPEQAGALARFLDEALGRLGPAVVDPELAGEALRIEAESSARWGEYLALLAPAPPPPAAPPDAGPADGPSSSIDPDQLLRMMSGLPAGPAAPSRPAAPPPPAPTAPRAPETAGGTAPPAAPRRPISLTEEDDGPAGPGPSIAADDLLRLFAASAAPAPPKAPVPSATPPRNPTPMPAAPIVPPIADPEAGMTAQEAFQADAEDLLERIEALTREMAGGGPPEEALAELDRCLHTLKGAAGAVGLSDLVATIHELEDRRLEPEGSASTPELVDRLQGLLGQVEEIIRGFGGADFGDADEGEPLEPGDGSDGRPEAAAAEQDQVPDEPEDGGGMVRVPRGKINDLLDLVAELLILNGPRSSWVGTLKGFADAARSCRNRLNTGIERLCDLDRLLIRVEDEPAGRPQAPTATATASDPIQAIGDLADHLGEQAEDLALLSQSARASAERMAEDLDSATRLTRRLWDLLHEVRIVPVESLFRRLARVAQAAALSEGRRVEVALIGEEIGLDRLVQDRVFEPLLHVVRNALGHGIEPSDERVRLGKPAVGRLTLEARRDGSLVVLEVRDDGRGLDYDAIAAKGRQLGMIAPGQALGVEELHALLFRPGFTTRRGADAISGRGIGMDVVAREVARLHGTIALESRAGAGTTIEIRLPARLTLEQTIIFRVDGQAYALPLEAIDWNDPRVHLADGEGGLRRVDAREVLDAPVAPAHLSPSALALRVGGESIALRVDAIDGPQELVVRPLHPLIAGHPLVSGTSLSADGELVLVLDAPALTGRLAAGRGDASVIPTFHTRATRPDPILVVDDSMSIRRLVVRHLHALGLEAVEATDGVEAVRELRNRPVRLVITDLQMPRMDGFELLQTLGSPEMAPAPPVLVSSTRTDPGTRRRIRELGAAGFLAKPVSLEELAEAIGPFLTHSPGAATRP